MKKSVLLLFTICLLVSCNNSSSGDWYVGDWEYDGPKLSWTLQAFSITEDNHFIQDGWEQELEAPQKNIYKIHNGDGAYVRLDASTKSAWVGDIDGETGPYHKKMTETTRATSDEAKSKKQKVKSSGNNSDKAWKSAFSDDGYLVLKSENQYTQLGRTSYIYIVLKGYGNNYKRGKVTIHFSHSIESVGIYDYDDGALVFPELYTATGYPEDDIAIEGRLFNVAFSPSISINEYKEPFRDAVTTIKYRQTNSGDLSGYKQSSNPHPRSR